MSRRLFLLITTIASVIFFFLPQSASASQIIFQDNFDSYPEGSLPPGWIPTTEIGSKTCNAQWRIHNGMLGISVNNEYSCITHLVPDSSIWNKLESNYIFEFDMKFVNGTDHNVFYRYTSQYTPSYELHFTSPGDFGIGVPPNSSFNLIKSGSYPNGQTYHIKIIVNDKNVQVLINGELVRDIVTQDNLPPGKIALRAGTGADPNSETWFDNIVVTTEDSGPTLIDFKQNRNSDSSLVPWALQKLFDVNSCPKMQSDGCAITSLADILASYKLPKLPDDTSVDPGNLNMYLAQNPGTHSGCYIYFNTAGRAINYNVLYNDFPQTVSLETRIKHIDDALDAGNLVIAGIDGHFVVFYKKAAPSAWDGSPDYFIADPYRYAPYASGDRTGKLLSEDYKTINQLEDKLQVVIVENKAPQPGMSWIVAAHSPVELLITDPDLVQTGFNPSDSTYPKYISNSTYGVQQGIIDDTGIEPPLPDIKYYGQNNPIPGTYKVQVIGTGMGLYSLDFGFAKGPGDTSLQTFPGIAAPGKIDTYLVTMFLDPSRSIIINKIVTYDILKADLQELFNQGFIDNKGIFNSLMKKIDSAIKSSDKESTKDILNSYTNELNAQRGKHITEEAYQILYDDSNFLIKSLSQ